MLNLDSVLVFSENAKALVEFYKKVTGQEVAWTGGEFSALKVGVSYLIFGPHDKVKGKSSNPERIIVNFSTSDVKEEFERIKGLGATVVAEPYHPGEEVSMWLATFADPDGNYFQIGSEMK